MVHAMSLVEFEQARSSRSYTLDEVLAYLDEENNEEEIDSEPEGMSSSEESELDHQLLNTSDNSRWVHV